MLSNISSAHRVENFSAINIDTIGGVKIKRIAPGEAVGSHDLDRWASRRSGGFSKAYTSKEERKQLKRWTKPPTTVQALTREDATALGILIERSAYGRGWFVSWPSGKTNGPFRQRLTRGITSNAIRRTVMANTENHRAEKLRIRHRVDGESFEMNKRENPDKLEPVEPQPIDTANDKLSFRKFRRRVIDQIMGSNHLSPDARLVGWSIAERLHHQTRSTLSSSKTLGDAVGLKPSEAQKGLDELVAASQARVHYSENGTRIISLVLIGGDGSDRPVIAKSNFFRTKDYLAFLSARARFLTDLFADRGVSKTDKLIAFAATRFIDVESGGVINETYEDIGRVVGYGKCATRQSLGRLVAISYFSKETIGNRAILTPNMDRQGSAQGSAEGSAAKTETPVPQPLPRLYLVTLVILGLSVRTWG
jgi:hypothetical protein